MKKAIQINNRFLFLLLKIYLIPILLLLIMGGCGKKNKTQSPPAHGGPSQEAPNTPAPSGPEPISTPTPPSPIMTEVQMLREKVNSNGFPALNIEKAYYFHFRTYPYSNYGQLNRIVSFDYEFSGNFPQGHPFTSEDDVKAYLLNEVLNPEKIKDTPQKIYPSVFYGNPAYLFNIYKITHHDGSIYYINLNLPLMANPIQIQIQWKNEQGQSQQVMLKESYFFLENQQEPAQLMAK